VRLPWTRSTACDGLTGGDAGRRHILIRTVRRSARAIHPTWSLGGGGALGDVMLATPGVAHVRSRQVALRCSEPGSRIGRMLALDWISVFYGFGGMAVAHGITTANEFAWVLEQARTELADPARTCVMPLYITYGQRVEEQS